jgi:hypothetical protein
METYQKVFAITCLILMTIMILLIGFMTVKDIQQSTSHIFIINGQKDCCEYYSCGAIGNCVIRECDSGHKYVTRELVVTKEVC